MRARQQLLNRLTYIYEASVTYHLVTGAVRQVAKIQNIFDSSLKHCRKVPLNNKVTKFYGNVSGKYETPSPSGHQIMRSHF